MAIERSKFSVKVPLLKTWSAYQVWEKPDKDPKVFWSFYIRYYRYYLETILDIIYVDMVEEDDLPIRYS